MFPRPTHTSRHYAINTPTNNLGATTPSVLNRQNTRNSASGSPPEIDWTQITPTASETRSPNISFSAPISSEAQIQRLVQLIKENALPGYQVNLEIKPMATNAYENLDGITLNLKDAEIYVSAEEAVRLGGIIKDAVTDFDQDSGPLEHPLQQADLFTFEHYRKLCANPSSSNEDALTPVSAMRLLSLSDYIGNDTAVSACKAWLFEKADYGTANRNESLFQSRLLQLMLEVSPSLWIDDLDHPANQHSRTPGTSTPSVNKPGLLKQLLIMAYPSTPLRHPEQNSDPASSIEGLYNYLVKQHDAGRITSLYEPLNLEMPKESHHLRSITINIEKCLRTNSTDALSAIFSATTREGTQGYDRHLARYFREICKKTNLNASENSKSEERYENGINEDSHPNTFCDAIFEAIPQNEFQRSSSEALALYIKTIQKRCGPTIVEATLQSPRGDSLLRAAAAVNDFATVQLLMQAGARIKHIKRGKLKKPEAIASFSKFGNHQAVDFLLNAGDSPNAHKALYYAIKYNHHSVVDCLVSAGASLSGSRYKRNHTPINLAALLGRPEIVSLLESKGCDINTVHTRFARIPTGRLERNPNGYIEVSEVTFRPIVEHCEMAIQETPLLTAISGGQLELASELLERGALMPATAWTVHAAIESDLYAGGDDFLQIVLDHYPQTLEALSVQQAGNLLRLVIERQNQTLLNKMLTLPIFTSDSVKRNKGLPQIKSPEDEVTAYKLYKSLNQGQQPEQDAIRAALKPSKKILSRFRRN